jgi:thiol-disulfide isomerase/thioredoxin
MKKLFLSLVILLAAASPSPAAVEVGDKPDLSFQSADGTPISLANLRGKMVIVDFWATWCGPCMAEAPHMVQLKDNFERKGVQLIGISLDSSKNQMNKICQEKGFTWPQYFDGKVWENKISTTWGVSGIPATFIIGPDGDVLWKGHPAGIDEALAKAMKEHPPRLLDPKALADATAALDKAEQLVTSKDFAAAIKSFVKIPADAKSETALAPRIDAVQKQLEDYATTSLDDAEKLIDQKEFGQAVVKLRDLSRLTGLPAAAEATKN